MLGLFLTLPVSIISFGYRFSDATNLQPVFIIQTIMFVLTFLLLAFVILKKKALLRPK